MKDKMLIYKTNEGNIPPSVVSHWQDWAVEYARKEKFPVSEEPGRWEVPSIVQGAFPEVGLLLWQHHGNNNGICGKIVIQPGYEDIREVQEKIGRPNDAICEETDYTGGMTVPLHSHPKLVYRGTEFFGSVIDELNQEGHKLYRVRKLDGNAAESHIFVGKRTNSNIERAIHERSGIELLVHAYQECAFDITKNLEEQGYPQKLSAAPLSSLYNERVRNANGEGIYTVTPGKQERFVGLTDNPVYVGGKGTSNLEEHGIRLTEKLRENVGSGYQNILVLKRGDVSPIVKWHWLTAKERACAAGEISGMPHMGQGSVDKGDLFHRVNYQQEDPLMLRYLRVNVLDGH